MYPSRFNYESPKTIAEAIKLLDAGNGEAKILAGGQSLIPMIKLRFAFPEQIVDINNIPGLDYIRFDADGSLHIGALVRHEHLEKSVEISMRQPTIAAAAPLVSDPIVRTRGTFVGSVCHADPQGDWAATMIALKGHLVVQGPKGTRTIAMKDFVLGPYANSLNYNEIAIEAVIPAPKGVARGGYLKLERRVGDFATASVAVALDMSGDTVLGAGFALAGVGGKTIDANDAASVLIGQKLTDATIAKVAALVAAKAEPRTDHRGSAEYKRHIVEIFVKRILVANSTQKVA
ncbi:MAG: xanthine dehydrogenase family protein subunit M [Actinomycetales bacterium]|nr:MAG: xanthine dehydrogenase family protein subunit M [Actinomycetales bacterium]